MMSKKDTIPILFAVGTYGTFVEWCLNYFSGEDVVKDPFDLHGNSHGFKGHHFPDLSGWKSYVDSDNNFKFGRLLPKVKESESVVKSIEEVLLSVDRAIVLYHDSMTLLCINNKFDKVFEEGWLLNKQQDFASKFKKYIRVSDHNKSSLNEMNAWEIREFLSFYIFKQHEAETENNQIIEYQNNNIKKVNIKDLFDNFENTIKDLLSWSKIDLVKKDFSQVYDLWISKQEHRHKDEITRKIINSVLEKHHYDWSNQKLSIVDEAFIQMSLRDLHNLDLRCYNLNVFPTNTKDLKELLFDV